ncbi:MAG: peptidase E [Patescibacteria group bacterium]
MDNKRKIVAIGGGEIGRPGYAIETEKIDREIIALSGKKRPKLLLLPTASGDSQLYYEVVKKYFGRKLGCETDVLYLFNNQLSRQEIIKKIQSADIIYVGGGNTLRMMRRWRKLGVDKILVKAWENGCIMSGVSAGSICWFEYGNSDSVKSVNKKAQLIRVRGLGMIPASHCPHYDFEKDRRIGIKKMMAKTPGVAICIDNRAAIEIVDNQYRIITDIKNVSAYKVFWQDGKYYQIKLPSHKWGDIGELLRKI